MFPSSSSKLSTSCLQSSSSKLSPILLIFMTMLQLGSNRQVERAQRWLYGNPASSIDFTSTISTSTIENSSSPTTLSLSTLCVNNRFFFHITTPSLHLGNRWAYIQNGSWNCCCWPPCCTLPKQTQSNPATPETLTSVCAFESIFVYWKCAKWLLNYLSILLRLRFVSLAPAKSRYMPKCCSLGTLEVLSQRGKSDDNELLHDQGELNSLRNYFWPLTL